MHDIDGQHRPVSSERAETAPMNEVHAVEAARWLAASGLLADSDSRPGCRYESDFAVVK